MLPLLFKLQFDTLATQLIYLAIGLCFVAYGAWAGAHNAEKPEHRLWRALPFALCACLVLTVGTIWAFPPMSPSFARLIQVLVYGFGALLTATAAFYGYRAAPKKDKATGEAITYGLVGAGLTFAAVKFGLSGEMGRDTGLPLHTYGLMIALAFGGAIALSARSARRAYPEAIVVDGKTIPAGPYMFDRALDIGFWMFVSGIAGAKLLFVIVNWDRYRHAPLEAFSLSGGLVFYGGFIGAAITLVYYCRRYHLNFLRLADALAPALAIGHMIGRLGCLAAGCCWGGFAKAGSLIAIRFPAAQHLPFGGFGTNSLAYSDQLKDSRWVDAMGQVHDHAVEGAVQIAAHAQQTGYTLPLYPTQLMEVVGELLLFGLLLFLMKRKRFNGQILATWLMGYAILRTIIEFFRGDVARGYVFKYPLDNPILLSTSQTIALALFSAGALITIFQLRRRHQSQKKQQQAAT
ncbi:MAG: prolipoprotein diacylglyceryl transferase [Myxococcales bacterium]|jgi:phosphatidylglycerol:prolipoprotein diacylglycerol transferase|nr:prolipoprotein diacylglyceryl transferase [Myxococcales bacterium]